MQTPQPRKPLAQVPPLDPSASRVVLASGELDRGSSQAATLATVRQVGPVYFDGKYVGEVAQNEYIIIDVTPGAHEVACSPMEPVRNYPEPRRVTFEPGQTKTLVCEMASGRGDLPGNYSSKTYLEARPVEAGQGTVVGYKKVP